MPQSRNWHKQARGRVPHPTNFGIVLYAKISSVGMSANEFARRVKMSSGFISGVYSGLKKPPLDRMDKWCSVLKLTGADKQAFIMLANLQHTPQPIVDVFWSEGGASTNLVKTLLVECSATPNVSTGKKTKKLVAA